MRGLIKLALFMALLMACVVWLAGQAVDMAHESNKQVMDQIEETN